MWPVRIHTLGAFSLTLNGKAVVLDDPTSSRAFELLKILIALGGHEVGHGNLVAAFLPQTRPDARSGAIDVALRTLRDELGESCIEVLPGGRISVNQNYCWVDALDFERTHAVARRIACGDYSHADAGRRLEEVSDRLLALYQGHFLATENTTHWSVSRRERLHMKFIQHLLDAGQYWESRGLWDKAMPLYQRGLDVDGLVEEFYQRLMACCLETNDINAGLAIYRRCRSVLSDALGLEPAPETEVLHNNLMGAMPGKHTA